MTAPVFGQTYTRPNDEPLPVLGADFSKVSMCSTSADADATVFPLDTPVRFSSTDNAYVSKLGTGYLADAVRGINAQLTSIGASADITLVRVAEGTAADATDKLEETFQNIIGTAAAETGLHALRAAPSEVNATGRLWMVPGYTSQTLTPGELNPILAELPAHLAAMLAVAVVDLDPSSRDAAIDQRELISSDRIIPVGVAARVFEGATTVTRPMAPRIVGIGIRTDNAHEGKPFHPWANQPVYGLVGTSRNIPFSMLDGATEGQLMLASDVGVVVRGEIGVDDAIADGGFVYIGTESCAEGELWSQFHQVRGSDYLTVKMMRLARQFLGKAVNADAVEAWVNSLRFMLRDHQADNDILGYKVKFKPEQNSAEQIRLGHLTVSPYIEPAPVFRVANHEIRRYRPAIDELVQTIVSRLNATA